MGKGGPEGSPCRADRQLTLCVNLMPSYYANITLPGGEGGSRGFSMQADRPLTLCVNLMPAYSGDGGSRGFPHVG